MQKKFKVYVSGDGDDDDDDDITNNASTTTRIETNQNNSIITNQRPCPVCEGRGHLPIKSKYISSQNNKAGVITSRRRRPVGWKEYGHVPSAVRASLRLLDVAAANDSSICDKDDNAPTQEDELLPDEREVEPGRVLRREEAEEILKRFDMNSK